MGLMLWMLVIKVEHVFNLSTTNCHSEFAHPDTLCLSRHPAIQAMASRSAAAAAVVTLAPCAPFGPVFSAAAAAIRPICRRNTYKLYQQSQRAIFILLLFLLFFFGVCSCWSVMVAWVGGQLILWRRNHKERNWFYYIIIIFSQRMYRLI